MDGQMLLDARRRLAAITHTCAVYTLLTHKLARLKHDAAVAKEVRYTVLNGFMSERWLDALDDEQTQRQVLTFAIAAVNRALADADKLTPEEEQRLRGVCCVSFAYCVCVVLVVVPPLSLSLTSQPALSPLSISLCACTCVQVSSLAPRRPSSRCCRSACVMSTAA